MGAGKPGGWPLSKGGPGGGTATSDGSVISQLLRDKATVDYFRPTSNDQRRQPRAALFDEEAEETAKKLAGIPASQLRRFFGAVMGMRRRLDLDPALGADFIQAEMALLKTRAAYTLARRKKRKEESETEDELLRFFVKHARSVGDKPTFQAFMRHFEAVMAYHKVYEKKQGRD